MLDEVDAILEVQAARASLPAYKDRNIARRFSICKKAAALMYIVPSDFAYFLLHLA